MVHLFRQISFPIRLTILFFVFCFNQILFLWVGWVCLTPFGFSNPLFLTQIPKSTIEINAFLFMQGCASIGSFLFTALLFAQLESKKPNKHLRLTTPVPVKMIVLAAIGILSAQFFIDFLATLNGKIPLPSWLSFLKDEEKNISDITDALLNFKRFGKFIMLTIVIAVIPAIGEEFFFRGLLLGDMLKEKINPAIAILSSALVFAITHFEFQNTLSICFLGIFLGYLYYISGSIWLSVIAHFINNELVLVLKYLYNTGVINEDLANASTPLYMTMIGIGIFALCIFVLNRWKKPAEFAYEEISADTQTPEY
jgi:uncharacterized protein